MTVKIYSIPSDAMSPPVDSGFVTDFVLASRYAELQRKHALTEDALKKTTEALDDALIVLGSEQRKVEGLAVENVQLKSSREVLAKNALETCNEVYSAGFRNTALHDGLMESTGNRNKYPNPIRSLVDEAVKDIETTVTDAALTEIRNQARAEGIYFTANRLLGAWDAGFIDSPYKEVIDIARMILSAADMLKDATDGDFSRNFADEMMTELAQELRKESGQCSN